MEFLQPAGAWAFLAAGAILALYFLRRRHVDTPVPSTLLWRRVAEDQSAAHPFQRLRRNPLLPLQLLAAGLMALALMRPALPGEMAGETVMILDCSASMQARADGQTRLKRAVALAMEQLDALAPEAPLTLLAVDGETHQLLSRSTDRRAARAALAALAPANTGADLSAALSLARAMDEELGGVRIVVFSDDFSAPAGVEAVNIQGGAENRALLSLSAAGGAAVARIANYGGAAELTVECYADGVLCDARRALAQEGETLSLRLSVPEGVKVLRAVLGEADAIATDNEAYCIARGDGETVVALAGSNTFWEHALTLRGDVRLVRTTQEEWEAVGNARLYVLDGDMVIFSRSPLLPALLAGEPAEPAQALSLSAVPGAETLVRNLTLSQVALRQYRPLRGGEGFLFCGADCLAAFGEDWVALGFDLHDSNLPLKYDFPLLIQNILSYLAPADQGVADGLCGQRLSLSAGAGEMETPSGRRVAVPESGEFTDTGEAGLYTLRMGEEAVSFALRMDPAESDVRKTAPSSAGEGAGARAGRRELTPWIMLVALLLILLEGGMSRRVA